MASVHADARFEPESPHLHRGYCSPRCCSGAGRALTPNRVLRALPWALLLFALGFPLALTLRDGPGDPGDAPTPLSDFGAVPEFQLTERSGRSVSRADLTGKPWVASFVYTSCRGPCPLLTGRMAKLAARAAERDVRLVSVSVDPATDTPQVLRAYADHYRAPADRWLFLTGPVDDVRRLVRDGFHLSVAESAEDSSHGGPITHSTRIALVDREGRIRRYYLDGVEPWVEGVLTDLDALESERARG